MTSVETPRDFEEFICENRKAITSATCQSFCFASNCAPLDAHVLTSASLKRKIALSHLSRACAIHLIPIPVGLNNLQTTFLHFCNHIKIFLPSNLIEKKNSNFSTAKNTNLKKIFLYYFLSYRGWYKNSRDKYKSAVIKGRLAATLG